GLSRSPLPPCRPGGADRPWHTDAGRRQLWPGGRVPQAQRQPHHALAHHHAGGRGGADPALRLAAKPGGL
ncbi:MAG: hypothetical protein AVDCRST_MAG15-2096, partial [uncultured Rubellimicrobium sp.]